MGVDHAQHRPVEVSPGDARYRATMRVTIVGSVVDLLLGVAKIAVGFAAQSQALIADGIHSLSDLITDFFVLYAARHASRAADEEHPYGHGRIETAATVGLGAALIAVAVGISWDAVRRLLSPDLLLQPGMWALVVAAISIVAKEAIYHYTIRAAKKYRSNMLRANAWHSRSDAISSIIVVVGVAGTMAGLNYLDAIAAVGVAAMVAKIGWDLAWHSVQDLVDRGLEPERVALIRDKIMNVDGVQTLHMLRTRRMGSDALVDVHILVAPRLSVSEGHHISESVRHQLISEIDEVTDVLVHIDPEDDETVDLSTRLPARAEVMRELRAAWQDLEAASGIQQVVLHYLGGKVHVDLYLPLALVEDRPDQTRQSLSEAFDAVASRVERVERIQLYFQ